MKAVSDVLRRVLMVEPKFFTVQYAINPWMGGTVNKSRAQIQWKELRSVIEGQGVEVVTMDQRPDLPDMVFVCNSGLVYGDNVYLAKFRHKERSGEQIHYHKWFQQKGFNIHGADYPIVFEGGGDCVFSNTETLWAGWGHRTSKDAYQHVQKMGISRLFFVSS